MAIAIATTTDTVFGAALDRLLAIFARPIAAVLAVLGAALELPQFTEHISALVF